VLEEYITEEKCFVVRFLWAKGLSPKNNNKGMFPVYGGKCLSRKAVHKGVEKFFQELPKIAVDARPNAEVVETTVKRLLCSGVRTTGKAMRQVYQCWWRICREINVFPRFEYHMFYVLYPFVTYILTFLRK
jgi:hypothetical protein